MRARTPSRGGAYTRSRAGQGPLCSEPDGLAPSRQRAERRGERAQGQQDKSQQDKSKGMGSENQSKSGQKDMKAEERQGQGANSRAQGQTGSSTNATALWTTRSLTVGIPSGRCPPWGLGM